MYSDLTERELAILTSLANGETYTDIIRELGLKKTLVAHSRKMLFLKLGEAKTAAHAVALGYHKGILKVPVRK